MNSRVCFCFVVICIFEFASCLSIFNAEECKEICKRCSKDNHVRQVCGDAGTVLEECGCCLICAKRKDDFCSGEGQCAVGLHCDTTHGPGTCQPKSAQPSVGQPPSRTLDESHRQPELKNKKQCELECTYEYCSKNPHSTCSARSNVIKRQGCQGDCQHTNCQACYFKRKKESPCPKCGKDDFECMKRFANCIHQETCSKHKFPCQPEYQRPNDGKFVCKVAACI